MNRQTDTWQNITFPHPSDAGGKNVVWHFCVEAQEWGGGGGLIQVKILGITLAESESNADIINTPVHNTIKAFWIAVSHGVGMGGVAGPCTLKMWI